MAWFGKGHVDNPDAELDRARQLMWRRETGEAVRVFDRLAGDSALEPIALAWRSLAHRMARRTDKALGDANKAAHLAPNALEPRAALVAAHLTNRDVVASVEAFSHLKSAEARDREGQFLHLLCFALLYDCIRNMREDADGLQLDFNLTPSAKGAVLLFDGQIGNAGRWLFDTHEATIALELARGLAAYRAEMWPDALDLLESCSASIERDAFNVGPALASLIEKARASAAA